MKVKSASSVRSKKDLFDFDEIEPLRTRSKLLETSQGVFLQKDHSIMMEFIHSEEEFHHSEIPYTNRNTWRTLGTTPEPVLQLFDSRLDCVEMEDIDKLKYRIKFKNQTESFLVDYLNLEKILSSGTIRGQNLLGYIIDALKDGSYLLIDELENHLNKEIIHVFFDLFNDPRYNPKGATLIFSTHYNELLDFFTRKDNIYVLRKQKEQTEVLKFSHQVNRNDFKKSDILLTNYIEGTAPKYETISLLTQAIHRIVSEENPHE